MRGLGAIFPLRLGACSLVFSPAGVDVDGDASTSRFDADPRRPDADPSQPDAALDEYDANSGPFDAAPVGLDAESPTICQLSFGQALCREENTTCIIEALDGESCTVACGFNHVCDGAGIALGNCDDGAISFANCNDSTGNRVCQCSLDTM